MKHSGHDPCLRDSEAVVHWSKFTGMYNWVDPHSGFFRCFIALFFNVYSTFVDQMHETF